METSRTIAEAIVRAEHPPGAFLNGFRFRFETIDAAVRGEFLTR